MRFSRSKLMSAQGFTLIEMVIVLSIACIIAPLSFMTLSHTSDEEKMKQFIEEVADTIRNAQMDAISKSTLVKILFDTSNHYYSITEANDVQKKQMDPRIQFHGNINNQYIMITRDGAFSNPGTYSFQCGSIWYYLVLQIGQGRFYFEKSSA